MKTLRLALAVAVVATFSVLASSPAGAYPGLECMVSNVKVIGGEDATVTASVDPAVSSDFTLHYQNQVHNDNGVTTTSATFDTHKVDHETETTVTGTVTQNGNTSPCTGTITLLPRHGDGDDDGNGDGDGDEGGLLPNTGGERLAWLIIGAMLVLVGGGVVVASRRRDA